MASCETKRRRSPRQGADAVSQTFGDGKRLTNRFSHLPERRKANTRAVCSMRFGVFFQLPVAHDQTDEVRYADTMSQVVFADSLGFDSAWFAESHFNARFSALPASLMLIAALGQRTRRIRLGTASVILPLHHPLMLAEEAATADLLTQGRLELGIGRGSSAAQFEALGIPYGQKDARFEEGYELLKQGLGGGTVSFRGRFWQVGGVVVAPGPTAHAIPIRVTANSPDAITWTAERKLPLILATIAIQCLTG